MNFYTTRIDELKVDASGVPVWVTVRENLDRYLLAADMDSAKEYILGVLRDKPRYPFTYETPVWKGAKLDDDDPDEEEMEWIQIHTERTWRVEVNEREYIKEILELDESVAIDFLKAYAKLHPETKVVPWG